jgi:hypothetical protein
MIHSTYIDVSLVSFMLSVVYVEYRKSALYADCRYAECHYAECRGAHTDCFHTNMAVIYVKNCFIRSGHVD